MEKHDREWYRQRAIEKKKRMKNYRDRVSRDLDELEVLKRQLLKQARQK